MLFRSGRRLAIKIRNAARVARGGTDGDVDSAALTEPLDRSMLAGLAETVMEATRAFEGYDYTSALEAAERSFWNWTDDYVELVKARAYGDGPEAASAHAALQLALSVYLRLFAPFLPFVTEEVWSWWKEDSVHRTSWPTVEELSALAGDPAVLTATAEVLAVVRRAKSDAKVSMRAELAQLAVTADAKTLDCLAQAKGDLLAAARAVELETAEGDFEVIAVLAEA